MDNNSLAIYVHELRNLIFNLQGAFNYFNGAMQAQQSAGVLYGGQMVLAPVSQLSQLLWPTRARARSRGEKLRQILQLDEKHVLNDRRVGEIQERGDEKLDEFIAVTKGDRVIVDFVGDITQFGPEFDVNGIYRAYDPTTKIYYYRGTAYNFQAIATSLQDLGNRINAVYRQMFPEQAKAEDEYRQQLLKQMQEQQAAQGAEAPIAANISQAEPETAAPAAAADAEEPKAEKAD